MDDHAARGRAPGSRGRDRQAAPRRTALAVLLGAALVPVAALTLAPEGAGWSWGSPAVELRWYLTGLDSPATVRQLLGNLALLVVPAVLAVLRWPALGRPDRLLLTAAATGTGIELLQWLLPLGRVVSPLDAALNAAGAVAAGLLVAAGTAGRSRGRVPGPAGVPG
ncbi:VanZ family protein [Blastococcus sp. VKM Ac-2987]|uniref:VanZ family protein n=1 Tax=Blastococcus sp. VKM Ac-2987 TaxID=3004141 RepID=UPI0022ABB34D|nr:VanZ family protein [Blastococcus sp. VKM Ac-2987]MCZ2860500.1 VanZ family protein [Blastococcus sp. VKM Ac-2987]